MELATRAWWLAILRLLGTVATGVILGWLVGHCVGRASLDASCAAPSVATRHPFRLDWWVRHRSYAPPPDLGGAWGEIVAQVMRLHRRKRFHKQRFIQLVRQIQRSTAALPDGVVILNAQREIVWFNRTASTLLGLRGHDDFGLRIDNLVRQPEFGRYLEQGAQYEVPLVIRPKVALETHLSLQVVPYGEGQQLLLVRDVSRQVRLEAMRKDFVANASHELRSPLTVISGYLETLGAGSGTGSGTKRASAWKCAVRLSA